MWSYSMGWQSGGGACRRRVTLLHALWKLSIGQSCAPPLYEQREYIGHIQWAEGAARQQILFQERYVVCCSQCSVV